MEKMLLVPLSIEELRQVFQQEVYALLDAVDRPHSAQEKDLLCTQEVCQLLHLSKAAIYGLVHRKAIPHMKQGKRLYFSHKALMAWMATKQRATQAEIEAQADNYLQQHSKPQ